MNNAHIRNLLYRVLIQISIGMAALATMSIIALAFGTMPSWDYPFACAVEALAFASAALFLQRQQFSAAGFALLVQLLMSTAVVARYPGIAAAYAVGDSVGACLMLAIIPQRFFRLTFIITLLAILWIILRPLLAISALSLGIWQIPISIITTVIMLGGAAWAGKNIIQIEHDIQTQLEQSLSQLHTAQGQLLRSAQDQAVIDTAIAATHDLAQPLTVILSEVGMLKAFPQAPAERSHALRNIERAAIQATEKLNRIRAVRHYVPTEYLNEITMLNLESEQAYDPQIKN